MAKISKQSEDKITQKLLESAQQADDKIIYAMCGIPGSGKTSYVQKKIQAGEFPKTAFILNPDIVMNNLDEYIQDKETLGAEKAFKKWEIPSRTLAYDLFYKAQFEGKSIIIDMGCAREENHQMLIALKEAGYKIHMTHIICDADVALERIQSRERFTPIDMVYKRAMVLDTLIPSYKALADTFEEFDNTPFREDIAITQ